MGGLRLGNAGGLSAQHSENLGQLFGGDEHLARLGPFGGADDLA